MKAILEFDLPEDNHEWMTAVHATELSVALWEAQNMLRDLWKHADLSDKTAHQVIDDIWRGFHDIAGPVMEATE